MRKGGFPMKIFVTGGMGSGKSTLIDFLSEKGAPVLDADKVGHENLHDPAMKSELREAFGDDIFDEAGEVIRPKLGAAAFVDQEHTDLLNSITRTRLYSRCLEKLEELEKTNDIVVLEMAILNPYDGFADNADVVAIVVAPLEDRVARQVARGFAEEDVRNRIAQQITDDERRMMADVVFENDGTLEHLKGQIDAWWESLTTQRAAEQAGE